MRVSPLHLKILVYTLDSEGFNPASVLSHCGFKSGDDIQEDGEWVPVEVFDRMMAAAIGVTGDPSFGLVAGKSLALMRAGAIVSLTLCTSSLRQALADMWRFAPLTVERAEMVLVESGQTARILVEPMVHQGVSGRFRMELVATGAMQLLKFAGADNGDVLRVEFPYPQPEPYDPRYAAIFGPHIYFDREECSISFNPALLDTPMRTHDPVAYQSSRTRAESALAAWLSQSNMAERVRNWLVTMFPRQPTTAETAAHLGLSERSLRRQLAALDTSHADLIQEAMLLMAERLLADGQAPLKGIADTLGFSSGSSFHRAFRRWTGMTPSDWRDRRIQKDD